jgi:hypothetical protein
MYLLVVLAIFASLAGCKSGIEMNCTQETYRVIGCKQLPESSFEIVYVTSDLNDTVGLSALAAKSDSLQNGSLVRLFIVKKYYFGSTTEWCRLIVKK